jgi:hypothetical protein
VGLALSLWKTTTLETYRSPCKLTDFGEGIVIFNGLYDFRESLDKFSYALGDTAVKTRWLGLDFRVKEGENVAS